MTTIGANVHLSVTITMVAVLGNGKVRVTLSNYNERPFLVIVIWLLNIVVE